MTGTRKRYSADFKAKVALEALRGELTAAQLATKHGIHPTMVNEWKRQARTGLASLFSGRAEAIEAAREGELDRLHAKIGQLLVERDFFGQSLRSMSVDRTREAIGPESPVLADLQHHGRCVLRRCPGRSHGMLRKTGHL